MSWSSRLEQLRFKYVPVLATWLLKASTHKGRTGEFARAHAGFNPGRAAISAAAVIERVAAGNGLH